MGRFRHNGGVADRVTIAPSPHGYGVLATAAIGEGETVVEVPSWLALSEATGNHTAFGPVIATLYTDPATRECVICVMWSGGRSLLQWPTIRGWQLRVAAISRLCPMCPCVCDRPRVDGVPLPGTVSDV